MTRPPLFLTAQSCGNRQIPALDLSDAHFVLLTGPQTGHGPAPVKMWGTPWHPLRCYRLGPDGSLIDTTGAWTSVYAVGPDGAVLVRPDGHVACRSQTDASPATRLVDAFSRIFVPR
jgi:putative polyketide hydroxylase